MTTRLALLLGIVAFAAWLAVGQWQTPQGLIQDTTLIPAQAVTNPRGEARITMRIAPCHTVAPAPMQLGDQT